MCCDRKFCALLFEVKWMVHDLLGNDHTQTLVACKFKYFASSWKSVASKIYEACYKPWEQHEIWEVLDHFSSPWSWSLKELPPCLFMEMKSFTDVVNLLRIKSLLKNHLFLKLIFFSLAKSLYILAKTSFWPTILQWSSIFVGLLFRFCPCFKMVVITILQFPLANLFSADTLACKKITIFCPPALFSWARDDYKVNLSIIKMQMLRLNL